MRNIFEKTLFVALLLWAFPVTLAAQDDAAKKRQDLENRLDRQQAEIDKLKEEIKGIKESPVLSQPFKFQVFGGLTAAFDNRSNSDNTFTLGELDLFSQADLGQNLSAMMELVFEGDDVTNEWEADIERINITWRYSDALSLTAGKFHCSYGYWTDQYHHGEYLYEPVRRPRMARFEDDGGFIPAHCIGVSASGRLGFISGLSYSVAVTNGRAAEREEVLNIQDSNNAKAVGATLAYDAFDLFTLGASIKRDKVDADIAGIGEFEFREVVSSAFVKHEVGSFAMIIEGFLMDHDRFDYEESQESKGAYLLMTYEIGAFTPYVLLERVDFPGNDPYLTELRDVNEGRLGVRWDFHPHAALKVEYDRTELRDDEIHATDDRYGTFLTSVSFFF